MKKKFSKILGVGLALVLMLTLGLVTAVPVAANPAQPVYLSPDGVRFVQSNLGAAEWSSDTANSGSWSVKLDTGIDPWTDWGGVQIASGLALTAFNTTGEGEDAVLDVSQTNFYYNVEDTLLGQVPIMALVFEDQEGGDWKLVLAPELPTWETGTGEWVKLTDAFTTGHLWKLGAPSQFDATYNWGTIPLYEELGWWQTNENSPIKDMTVDYVEVSIGTKPATVYVDDIAINGVTYDLEPIVLDAEYYSVVDTVGVTVCNGNANADPVRIDEVDVSATSASDLVGIALTLEETDVNTGVFTVSFLTTGTTPPGVGELLVNDGDAITATYTGDWGAGSQTLTATATVDDTAPDFTIVADGDYYKNTDIITLTATLDAAGYTVSADFSSIDSEYTIGVEEFEDVDDGTYTITYAIDEANMTGDGTYFIPVTAEDAAGNSTSYLLFSTTLDNTAPAVTDLTADPAVIQPDTPDTVVTFTVSVSDGEGFSGVETVTIDLSDPAIGEGAAETMDEVMDGEVGTGIYTCDATLTVALEDEGTYELPITATDTVGNVNDTEAITLRVIADDIPPVIVSAEVEYPVGAVSARVGDPVVITAVVTDDLAGVHTVTVDATDIELGTEELSLEAGTWTKELVVGAEATTGIKTLLITATDFAGNSSVPTTVEVVVVISLTGYNITLFEGWNLISLPLIPDYPAIETVLGDVIVDSVWAYEPTYLTDGIDNNEDGTIDEAVEAWLSYSPVAPSDLTYMRDGKGYWAEMTAAATLTIMGKELPDPPATPPTYAVVEGWNLIGFKSVEDKPAHDYLLAIVSDVVMIYGYDAEASIYIVVNPAAAEAGDNFEVGHGYWIAVTETGTIYP